MLYQLSYSRVGLRFALGPRARNGLTGRERGALGAVRWPRALPWPAVALLPLPFPPP